MAGPAGRSGAGSWQTRESVRPWMWWWLEEDMGAEAKSPVTLDRGVTLPWKDSSLCLERPGWQAGLDHGAKITFNIRSASQRLILSASWAPQPWVCPSRSWAPLAGPAGAGDSGLRRGTGRKAAGAVQCERGPVDTVAVSVDSRYVNGAASCEGQSYCIWCLRTFCTEKGTQNLFFFF